jgi:hypothetical protein
LSKITNERNQLALGQVRLVKGGGLGEKKNQSALLLYISEVIKEQSSDARIANKVYVSHLKPLITLSMMTNSLQSWVICEGNLGRIYFCNGENSSL